MPIWLHCKFNKHLKLFQFWWFRTELWQFNQKAGCVFRQLNATRVRLFIGMNAPLNAAPSATPLPAAPRSVLSSDHNFSSNEADQSGPGQTGCCWRTNYCNFCSPSSPHPSLVPLCFKFPFSTWLIPSTLNKMFSFCPMSCWELARDLKLNMIVQSTPCTMII